MEYILLFRLGAVTYGLEIDHIQEVVESPRLHYIPRAPVTILGAINVQGHILAVLDLASHLGQEGGERDHRIIALADDSCRLAFAVSALGRIVPCHPESLLAHPDAGAKDCIRARFEREGELVHLLDLPRLMTTLILF